MGDAEFDSTDFTVIAGKVSLAVSAAIQTINTDGSAAAPAANAITIAGGTGITTSGSGSTITATLDTPVTVANGGTGRATGSVAYGVICAGTTATAAQQTVASVGSSGQVLTSNGAGALPTFQASAAGDVTKVGTPVDSQIGVWTGDGTIEGDADFTFDTSTDTLTIAASGKLNFGAVQILSDSAGTTTLANIDAIDATTETTIEAAIDTLANLTAASSLATVGTISTGTWEATDVGAAHGGTGRSSHTAYAVICGGTTTTAAQQSIASVGTSGQVLTSNGAGALPTFQAAAAGGLSWSVITDASKTMVVNEGYIGNRATAITFTLPTTAAVGDQVAITNIGAGLPVIAQNAGEDISVVGSTTTTGVGGSLTATEQFDSIHLICTVANTNWNVLNMTGNWTIV
jgi:hypothetical protein